MKRTLILAAALAFTGAGCSDLTATTTTRQTRTSNEVAPAHAPVQTTGRAQASAVAAIRRFATAYINWNARTIAADMSALAARSIDQARSAVQLAAADTAQDYELRRGGIANRGTVEAIAPLPGGHNRYVVVTLERTTASNTSAYQGLRPAWHVALATVAHLTPVGWVVSGWQPEN